MSHNVTLVFNLTHNAIEFCWSTGTIKLTDLEEDIHEIWLWRAGLLVHEGELTIYFHHQQLFGNVFERKAKYCCGVLGSHQCRVQSKKQISLLMVKQFKAKGYNVYPGHSLCCQCVKRVIRMNHMLSIMNQIMTNLVKCQVRSSIPALSLWVSPPVHLHGVAQHSWVSTAKHKLDRAVEVLKTPSWDAYVVSTDHFASYESVVISETKQKTS